MNDSAVVSQHVNEKTFQLLMQVAVNDEPVTAKVLSEQLDMPLSSLYRHLKLLKEWNMVEESPYDKTLVVGAAALLLMRSYQTSSHNLDAIDLVLSRLQKQTGEMAAYMVPVGYRALCVSQKESLQALRCSYVQGQSQPLLRGASSKVMLAYLPEKRCEKILHHFDEHENLEYWTEEVQKIRNHGYAFSNSETDPGVCSISAPVMKGNKLMGAVSLMSPAHRMKSNKSKMTLYVLQAARALSLER